MDQFSTQNKKEGDMEKELRDMKTQLDLQTTMIEKMNKQKAETGSKDLKEKIVMLELTLDDRDEVITKLRNKRSRHQIDLFRYKHTGLFVQGIEFVERKEFAELFDTGVPLENTGYANNKVMLLYSDLTSFPDKNATEKTDDNGWKGFSVEDATKRCKSLNVVYTAVGKKGHCTAIMGQYESGHVQKFMRLTEKERKKDRKLDMEAPLRLVNRNMKMNGDRSIGPPNQKNTEKSWELLVPYLNSLKKELDELKPIAKSVASNNSYKTIIVMVCNFGHSEMLLNFVCNAHAKGMSDLLKSVMLFSTDIETHEFAKSLGLASFFSEAIFGYVPKQAAEVYGDGTYSRIMMSKVYCAHLISQLGYDFLFQDVDVVWYKNPLPVFHSDVPDKNNFIATKWDMIFQDDGSRQLFFAPYSANTGFYFVRHTKATVYFFNHFLMSGDLVLELFSHQSALIALLAEQASLMGLKIKTWNRNAEEFPGGYAFHSEPKYMKKLILSKNSTDGRGLVESATGKKDSIDPYIFHMSWTANKDNKLKFFEQLGEWYLKDECHAGSDKFQADIAKSATINSCCAAKPLVKCYFKDKPSIIPCPDAPNLDKAKKSFW